MSQNVMENSTPLQPAEKTQQESDIIHRELPMSYQAPAETPDEMVLPVLERDPRMVTRLAKLGPAPADVDCPYCKRVVRTEPRHISSGDDGMMQCLICLVCCPLLLCYQGDQDLDHHCSVCKRKLTHQPSGNGVVQVVAEPKSQDLYEPSRFEQSTRDSLVRDGVRSPKRAF